MASEAKSAGGMSAGFREAVEPKLLANHSVMPNGCWMWSAGKNSHGYGYTNFRRKHVRAHRAAYLIWKGAIPEKMELDHLCRNRACINPAHLELVTSRENTLRGDGITSRAAAATHCPKGHKYDGINTYLTPKGHRDCRECRRSAQRRSRTKFRAAISKATGGAQP